MVGITIVLEAMRCVWVISATKLRDNSERALDSPKMVLRRNRSECDEWISLLLFFIFDRSIPSPSNKGQKDAEHVHWGNYKVKDEYRQYHSQDLLHICYIFQKSVMALGITLHEIYLPATFMANGPDFLLAVKLTTFSPNAIIPFTHRASIFLESIRVAPNLRTRSSSPLAHP